jgi:hypothetical protein
VKVSQEYLDHLIAKDFLGELAPDEIPIAKRLKIYGWDEIMKARGHEQK